MQIENDLRTRPEHFEYVRGAPEMLDYAEVIMLSRDSPLNRRAKPAQPIDQRRRSANRSHSVSRIPRQSIPPMARQGNDLLRTHEILRKQSRFPRVGNKDEIDRRDPREIVDE